MVLCSGMSATPTVITVWLEGSRSTNVLPSAVGVGVSGEMLKVLERGTALPATDSCHVTTAADYQTTVNVRVFSGDHRKTDRNTLVDGVRLRGISPRKQGEVDIKLKLTVDVDGQVKLRAEEITSVEVWMWNDVVFRQKIRK